MNILNRYLARNILLSLTLAVGLATFVMVIGFFAKSIDLLSRGVSLEPLLLFILFKTPQLLSYTIPMGLLVATVLVFNRMSADNEITALRAGGVSLLQLTAPMILLGLILSIVSGTLLFYVAPEFSDRANWMIREKAVTSIVDLIETNNYKELTKGVLVYIGRKDGNHLQDIRVCRFTELGVLSDDITAASGEIQVDVAAKTMDLILHDAIIVSVDPAAPYDANKMRRVAAGESHIPLDYGESLNRSRLMRKFSNMTLPQLLVYLRMLGTANGDMERPLVELHKRAVLALAPFTFVLLGIPLGMTVGRKENYTGLVTSLVVAVFYYGSILLIESQGNQAELHSEMLIWIPNLAFQGIGIWGLWRRR